MKKRLWMLATLWISMSGCSGGDEKVAVQQPKEDHLFQVQADALEKAKGVEKMLQDAADAQRRSIEEKTR